MMHVTSALDRPKWLRTFVVCLPLVFLFLSGTSPAFASPSQAAELRDGVGLMGVEPSGERLSVRDILQNNGCDNGECEDGRLMASILQGWVTALGCDFKLDEAPGTGIGYLIEECLRWMGLSLEP